MKKYNNEWIFYKNTNEKWQWIRQTPNKYIVDSSTKRFKNKADCEKDAKRNQYKKI